jgi:hypothetical protein
MSDLSPFVAAAISGKEFPEENKKHRNKKESDAETIHPNAIQNSLKGCHGNTYVTVMGPLPVDENQDPVVYAIEQVYPKVLPEYSFKGCEKIIGFQKIKECTLGDLRNASVFINGQSCGTFPEATIMLYLEMPMEFNADAGSLVELLAEWDHGHSCESCVKTQPLIDTLLFHLKDVSKAKWFELARIDINAFLSNPTAFENVDRYYGVSMDELIACVGADAIVEFDMVEMF